MLDLRCHPGGIFAVAGRILILDIGWQSFIPPYQGACPATAGGIKGVVGIGY